MDSGSQQLFLMMSSKIMYDCAPMIRSQKTTMSNLPYIGYMYCVEMKFLQGIATFSIEVVVSDKLAALPSVEKV